MERKEKRKERKRDVQTFDFSLQFQSGVYITQHHQDSYFSPKPTLLIFCPYVHIFLRFSTLFSPQISFFWCLPFLMSIFPLRPLKMIQNIYPSRDDFYFSFRSISVSVAVPVQFQIEFRFNLSSVSVRGIYTTRTLIFPPNQHY